MKVLVVLAAVAVALAAGAPEAPRYRAPPAPVREYGAPEQAQEPPYAPAGWRPSGRQFLLPFQQFQQDSYYLPPPREYGPPEVAPTEPTTTEQPTTTEIATTENPEEDKSSEETEAGSGASENEADRDPAPAGVYYVLLPDGRLQRVAYSTNPAVPPPAAAPLKNAGYTQLHYSDVEPIRAPVYTYGAQLIRVF